MHSVHPTPKFSIITVTYNAEKVLEDTIQSVISEPPKTVLSLSSTDTGHGYTPSSANRTKDCTMP